MNNTKKIGDLAEDIAVRYLKKYGDKIVERNYRKRWGEVDIISKRGDIIVFTEVKANSQQYDDRAFSPELRVDQNKVRKIVKTAEMYLEKKRETAWQIDIISVVFIEENSDQKIEHFENISGNIQ